MDHWHKSPEQQLQAAKQRLVKTVLDQPELNSGLMDAVRKAVIAAEKAMALERGLDVTIEELDSFELGGWDINLTHKWLVQGVKDVGHCNTRLELFVRENNRLKEDYYELSRPDPEVVAAWEEKKAEVEAISKEITLLINKVEDAKKEVQEASEAENKARAEMGAKDSSHEKLAQAKLAAKVQQLRLKTIKANQKEYFTRVPLRLRRSVLQDENEANAPSYEIARKRWFRCERVVHWLFFSDTERKITEDEKLWVKKKAHKKSVDSRKARNRWSPYECVQYVVERNVGGNVAQVFTFYQFIMVNNFVMSNMWTFFVILPFFLDPPPEFDMSSVTWMGLAGMDDKGLEYSWFYYGAYKENVTIFGFDYPMGIMYIVVLASMFLFQLAVMVSGVFDSLKDDMRVEKILDSPYEGIEFSVGVLLASNHCIINPTVKYDFKRNNVKRLKKLCDKVFDERDAADNPIMKGPAQPRSKKNPFVENLKNVVGRTFGTLLYIGLFQISINGIQFCYANEESINGVMPYLVPLLVTSQRVLVPVLMVPFFLSFEYREEPNLFYHTIVRMFLLKVFTLNIILQVLLSTPVPGGICRAIFVGKVYWRQEMVDLLFSIILDLIFMIRRLRKPILPEFDEEELAERVMELLYRQAFIWVSAPYSPMLAYLGLFSTSVLYFWQSVTIPLSYSPPIRGWGVSPANKSFRVQLLCTALCTFYPTWIFLHQKMDCGPHAKTHSPYQYMKDQIAGGPQWLYEIVYWITVPSTTVALLMSSIAVQVFLMALNLSRNHKVNSAIDKLDAERHDKVQLVRACGLAL